MWIQQTKGTGGLIQMKIVIESTDNGAIIRTSKDMWSDFNRIFGYVFDEYEKDGLKDLLYDIRQMMDTLDSRYSKQRIQIQIVHGDKYECADKDCEICKGEE